MVEEIRNPGVFYVMEPEWIRRQVGHYQGFQDPQILMSYSFSSLNVLCVDKDIITWTRFIET